MIPDSPNTSDNSLHPFNNKLGILFICMLIPSLCRYNKRLDLLKKAFPPIQRIAFSHTQEIGTTHACAVHNLKASTSANKISTSANKISTSANKISTSANKISTSASKISASGSKISTSANTKSTSANKIFTSANTKSTSANKASKSANKYYVSFPVYVFLLRTACHTRAPVLAG